MKKNYLEPMAVVLPMTMETIVCTSGNGSNLTHDGSLSGDDEDEFWN